MKKIRGGSSGLLLGLLAGLFIAGAAAVLLWPSERSAQVAVKEESAQRRIVAANRPAPSAPSARQAPAPRSEQSSRAAAPPAQSRIEAPAPSSPEPSSPAPPPPAREPEPEPPAPPPVVAALPTVPPPAPPPTSSTPTWLRYAVASRPAAGRPIIAVVLDDVGLNRPQSRRAVALPGPITLSFLTYADDLPQQTAAAHAAGHELMLHFPMEPIESSVSPGPEALTVSANEAELQRRLDWGLGRFTGFVGINNHMGSRFTQDSAGMSVVLAELKRRGLLFLDSVTTGKTVGTAVATRYGVPFAKRDVFLDHKQDAASVRESLAQLEQRARTQGYAVGIGHPHETTIDVLQAWLPSLEARGFTLVPLTAIVKRLQRDEERRDEAAAAPPRG